MRNLYRNLPGVFFDVPLVFILILISLIIRYFSASWRPEFPDSFTYLKLSQSIQEGKYYLETWARGEMVVKPLYSIMTTIFSLFSNAIESGAIWVSLLSGCLLIVPLFYLAKWIAGKKVAWISVIIAAINPELIWYSTYVLTESMYTFIFILTLAAGFWIMREKRPPYLWMVLGIIVGINLLGRDVGLICIPVFLFWIALYEMFYRKDGKKALLCVALFLVGIILFKGAFMISTAGKEIKSQPIGEAIIKTLILPDIRNSAVREKYLSMLTADGRDYMINQHNFIDQGIIQTIWKYKDFIAWKFMINLTGFMKVIGKSFPFIVILLFITGLIRNIFFTQDLIKRFYLFSWVVVYLLFYVAAGAYTLAIHPMVIQRYLIPLFPLVFIWAGMGIVWISDSLASSLRNRIRFPSGIEYIVIVLLTLLMITTYFPELKIISKEWANREGRKNLYQRVGEAIGSKYSGSIIMSRLPTIPYYARSSWLVIPDEPIERILHFARYKGVDLIVVDSKITIEARPQLAPLLERGSKVEGLKAELGLPDRRNPRQLDLAVYSVLKD